MADLPALANAAVKLDKSWNVANQAVMDYTKNQDPTRPMGIGALPILGTGFIDDLSFVPAWHHWFTPFESVPAATIKVKDWAAWYYTQTNFWINQTQRFLQTANEAERMTLSGPFNLVASRNATLVDHGIAPGGIVENRWYQGLPGVRAVEQALEAGGAAASMVYEEAVVLIMKAGATFFYGLRIAGALLFGVAAIKLFYSYVIGIAGDTRTRYLGGIGIFAGGALIGYFTATALFNTLMTIQVLKTLPGLLSGAVGILSTAAGARAFTAASENIATLAATPLKDLPKAITAMKGMNPTTIVADTVEAWAKIHPVEAAWWKQLGANRVAMEMAAPGGALSKAADFAKSEAIAKGLTGFEPVVHPSPSRIPPELLPPK